MRGKRHTKEFTETDWGAEVDILESVFAKISGLDWDSAVERDFSSTNISAFSSTSSEYNCLLNFDSLLIGEGESIDFPSSLEEEFPESFRRGSERKREE